MKCAVDYEFFNFWVESNSQVLTKVINSSGFDLSPERSLLAEIRAHISSLRVRGVNYIPRSLNKVVLNLASFAISELVSCV